MIDLLATLVVAQQSTSIEVEQVAKLGEREQLLAKEVSVAVQDQGNPQAEAEVNQVPEPEPEVYRAVITDYQEIRPLPGKLNDVPVFNSNSPEVISEEGILLSTFPKQGKSSPIAHLDTPLSGRFDIFSHHISRPSAEPQTLYQGLVINNPTGSTRTLRVLQGLSYLNSRDAPFQDLPSFLDDPNGRIYSGPGSRLVGDILRGQTQAEFPETLRIPPYSTAVLASLPIPVSSSRSTYLQVESDGAIYLANLAQYEIQEEIPTLLINSQDEIIDDTLTISRPPNLNDWRALLTRGGLAQPRDRAPNFSNDPSDNIYGRVAGITVGSEWRADITDRKRDHLRIPDPGKAIAFPISTTHTGNFMTNQVQSAPMLTRYPDTALQGHGNYLVRYKLRFPLKNKTSDDQRVALTFQTPIKDNTYDDRLFFLEPPPERPFYRGTVKITYPNKDQDEIVRYVHLVQHRGERSQPLATIDIPKGKERVAEIEFFYPPDATPPQVITVETLRQR